jgi:hypothetical protein
VHAVDHDHGGRVAVAVVPHAGPSSGAGVVGNEIPVHAERRGEENLHLAMKAVLVGNPTLVDRVRSRDLKIDNDLERIGVLAVSIAKYSRQFSGKDHVDRAYKIPRMAENAQSMLLQSLDSVVEMDVSLAREVLAADDEVDSDYPEMNRALRTSSRV